MNFDFFQKIFVKDKNIFIQNFDDKSKTEFDANYKKNLFDDKSFVMYLTCKPKRVDTLQIDLYFHQRIKDILFHVK